MLQIKTAMELTTSHGLPRVVTNKPAYVRILWLLLFLFMAGLFLKGFIDLVVKLQSRQVTNTLEAGSVNFQFPDVYACFENPISGSYSDNIDNASAAALNSHLNRIKAILDREIGSLGVTGMAAQQMNMAMSFAYPQSMPYNLLFDILAHRSEQDIITSDITYNTDFGMPIFQPIYANNFNHPAFLRCQKWTLNSTFQSKIVQTGSASGLVLTLNMDTNYSGIASTGADILPYVYATGTRIPVSDWSLSLSDFNGPDKRSGLRVFLAPPGEYPSVYVTSFSLGPGKYHTVEIGMTQQVYKDDQFDCVSDPPDVQFVNPYDQTPYNHMYSYSYCYYYEYHKQFQELVTMSGFSGPLPWPLNGTRFVSNVSGDPTFFIYFRNSTLAELSNVIDTKAKANCLKKKPCITLDYSVSISSADWPTQSSLTSFVSNSVNKAWTSAKDRNLSAPALKFLMNGSASSVASYVRSNLLKVHFKPHKVACDKVTFSIEYVLTNFISDVGGIMGIYLGMSLLTIFELFELFYDLIAFGRSRKAAARPAPRASPKEEMMDVLDA